MTRIASTSSPFQIIEKVRVANKSKFKIISRKYSKFRHKMKEIAKLVSRETAKQEELPVTEENEIQCLYQNLFVSLEEARNQTSNTIEPGDISKKIKRLEDDFNKSFTIFTEYNKNPQYGLLMITTSNNESMHNALKNHYKMNMCPNLIDLFQKLQR
ncbi:hypothetical protein C6P40_000857 [Pichia californica]|uniref:Uncharacterized protein n=1 Tax=Pichia californica TaxID=460514 RepID=A0A9P6WMP9_9ASCO|nr:hypothetical protein C6P42_003270 [[Candida] californica]KAG0688538.1 hypothetical protein C6P40_000857 [[Candida] californica]